MKFHRRETRGLAAASILALLSPVAVQADEGGASVWLPGQFASFAAVPNTPGLSVEALFYGQTASATANISFSRGGGLLAGFSTKSLYLYLTPSYAFAEPVLHGQLSIGVTFSAAGVAASVSGVLIDPISGVLAGTRSDSVASIGDLYPTASLRWQVGSHNFMTYMMASVPTGAYDPNRLAGVGVGHWAVDAGMGYTFLSKSGFEFSITAGLTHNFMNPTTQYQSGMDGHIDIGTSYSLSDALYVGAVGYLYNQVSPDSGGDLGAFYSRVAGVGPQLGWSFTIGRVAIDLNMRAYREFAAQNRLEGWNAWLTVTASRAKHRPGN